MAPREGLRFRPLLEVGRAEVLDYCRERGLSPVEDPTNADLRYARNRVRRKLLPELETYNPAIREALARLADAAREEHAAVAAWAEAILDPASGNAVIERRPGSGRPGSGGPRAGVTGYDLPGAGLPAPASLPRAALRALPDAVAVEVLRRLWAGAAGGPPPAGRDRLRQALRLVRGRRSGRWPLGAEAVLVVAADTFQVALETQDQRPVATGEGFSRQPPDPNSQGPFRRGF
jgi:tRNA(Ile)-lysidine synthase